jgi:hypothetical protein
MAMAAETEEMRSKRRYRRTLFDGIAELHQASRRGYPSEIVGSESGNRVTAGRGVRAGSQPDLRHLHETAGSFACEGRGDDGRGDDGRASGFRAPPSVLAGPNRCSSMMRMVPSTSKISATWRALS